MSQLINRAQLGRFSDKPALVHRLIQMYMEISPGKIAEIESAASNMDIEQVGTHAHSLKGSSAELGAEDLAELSHQLQMAARNQLTPSIDSLIVELKHCYKKTATALQELDPC